VRLGSEINRALSILWKFAAKYNILVIRAKDPNECTHVELLGRGNELFCSLLWSVKAAGPDGSSGSSSRNLFRRGLLRSKNS
jgi:hypothetical protein